MSDTILSTRWKVFYSAENRQKRVVRDTTVTPTVTDTVNAVYSALQDLFDELTQMDDGVPMSAQTPTEYTIGIIDAGDKDPWFIDRTSVEYLTGGALKTASWQRSLPGNGTGNVGIVTVVCDNTNIDATDIGLDITCTAGDDGTLLDVKGTGAGSILWIRPDTNALADDWDSTSGTITVTSSGHTATQSAAGTSAGESLWANIYSIGTIESNTHIYIYQEGSYLNAYKGTSDWWGEHATTGSGHIDILVNVKNLGVESDEGYITVMARQYSKSYSYYIVDLTNGGRNPIPLQTGKDLDNQTGYRKLTLTASAASFDVGNYIYWTSSGTLTWSTTTKKAVITAVSGNDISYYLIGEPILDFSANDTVIQEYTGAANGDGTGTVSASAPVNIGAALDDATYNLSATHATNSTFDVDEDGTNEHYSIVVDCDSRPLADVYQWAKWVTRRGETAHDTDTDSLNGEAYIGSDYRLLVSGAITGTVAEGDTITQAGTGAKATIVAKNTTASPKIIILRNSRGTFDTSGLVTGSQAGTFTPSGVAPISPIAAAPFGTFAGGKFFCAPGVYLTNRLSADLNNFQLVDDTGVVRLAPIKVNVTIGNTRLGDKVAAFRLTAAGGDIQKDRYSATVQSAGATTLVIDTGGGITTDEPGKTTGGVLRLVDINADPTLTKEYRIRFGSWSGSTFKLAGHADHDNTTGLIADAGSNTTTIVDAGIFTNTKVGDLIRSISPAGISYVTVVDPSFNNVTISPAIASFTTGSTYEINTLPVATATDDTVYVPFIDAYETVGSDGTPGDETVQIVRLADVPVRVRARRSGVLSNRIIPFEQDSTIGSNGMSVSVIRSLDSIVT